MLRSRRFAITLSGFAMSQLAIIALFSAWMPDLRGDPATPCCLSSFSKPMSLYSHEPGICDD
jgi:hypothetical protein